MDKRFEEAKEKNYKPSEAIKSSFRKHAKSQALKNKKEKVAGKMKTYSGHLEGPEGLPWSFKKFDKKRINELLKQNKRYTVGRMEEDKD